MNLQPINLNNNNNFYPPPNVSTSINQFPLKFATFNVNGLNSSDSIKQQLLLDTMELQNIQICGISETNLNDRSSKLIYKNDSKYQAFFTGNQKNNHGSGTGIIMTKDLAKYVQRYQGFEGRVMHVDMYMRGNVKLRVIQIYSYAKHTSATKQNAIRLNNYVKLIIEEAHQKQFYFVVMGDFNLNYSSYKTLRQTNALVTNWKYQLLNHVYDKCVEVTELLSDKILDTHFPYDIYKRSSKLDYIWVSNNLAPLIIDYEIAPPTLFKYDHYSVEFRMWASELFCKKQHAKLKQQRIYKTRYLYNDMTDDDWAKYTSQTKFICDVMYMKDETYDDVSAINRQWDDIQYAIKLAAKDNIKQRTSVIKDDPHLIKNSELHQNLRYLQKLLYKINRAAKHQDLSFITPVNTPSWINIKAKLFAISQEFETQINLPELSVPTLMQFNVQVKELYNIVLMDYKIQMRAYQNEQIKSFVQRRCDDLKDNQKRMIDSIANREMKSIVIDRLVIDQNNDLSLITDPTSIKRLVNEHFQTCPGVVNRDKPIPEDWVTQYSPKEDIDETIYDNLMLEPTWEEWICAIGSLPKGKATGPSGISNEMLLHIDDSLQQAIWKLACACMRNNTMPDAWRLANIYPIPKPKPWECRLNNTRPITLLKTTCKAFVSILNKRLANIFVKNNVLKGNQFAGLPGKSTFEPIRIMNEIIQDAKEEKKDL